MKENGSRKLRLRWDAALVTAVIAVGVLFSAAAYGLAEYRRRDFLRERMGDTAQAIAADLHGRVRTTSAFVDAIAAFFESSNEVTVEEFQAFVQRSAANWPGLDFVAWQPVVAGADRARFEAEMIGAGQPGFQIVDQDGDGATSPAPVRDSYVPVAFRYSVRGKGPPLGLDLRAIPSRMASKMRALELGTPVASPLHGSSSQLDDGEEARTGFAISAAVLARGSELPRDRLRGFVVAVFKVRPILAAALEGRDIAGLRIRISDEVAAGGVMDLVVDGPGAAGQDRGEILPFVESIGLPQPIMRLAVESTRALQHGATAALPAVVGGLGLAGTLVVGLMLTARVRERRRRLLLDQGRHAAERKFHDVVENMAGAVAVFGASEQGTQFLVWDLNAAALGLARTDGASLVGASLSEAFGADVHRHLFDALRRVWGSGQSERLPPFAFTREGVVRWLGCNVFRLDSGEIVTICNDLTSQKEVEQELRQARAELELALDASRVGLWSWDRRSGIARIDARTADMLDVGTTTTLQRADIEERIPAEDMARLTAEAQTAMLHLREFECEVRHVARDGSQRHLSMRARPAADPTGDVLQIVGCVWDSTDRHRMGQHEQRLMRLESVATLAGSVAHDLNNALVPISVGLDMLGLPDGEPNETAETVRLMTASTRKATAIVRQLSGLTQGDDGREVQADPRRVVADLVAKLRSSLPGGIALLAEPVAAEISAVKTETAVVQQVLSSLCANAREAMGTAGTLTIRCAMARVDAAQRAEFPELAPGAYVAFSVEDTGGGIPAAICGRIFDPFFTTKEAGGAGLGLATALAVVRARKGAIRFETRVGEGTQFRVLLPAAVCSARVANGSTTEVRPAQTRTVAARCVLLADDEDIVREVARRVLELAGWRVLTAQDGREAIEVFSRQPDAIDVVVLDLVMPDVDGIAALAAIRGLRSKVPVLGASGYGSAALLEKTRVAGFTAFLPKPYTMDQLLEAVRAAATEAVKV